LSGAADDELRRLHARMRADHQAWLAASDGHGQSALPH
jgi:hypothetical protein